MSLKWLENIKNPHHPKTVPSTGVQDPEEIRNYNILIQGKVVGDPIPHDKFAEHFNAEEMKDMGWVGLYVSE